jgi:hypothetical protein
LRVLFITETRTNAGSIQAVASYVSAADELGHTIAVFGCRDPSFPKVRFSMDTDQFDFVVFILESKLNWLSGLRVARILKAVPAERRAVLDADGLYNDLVSLGEYDRNHASGAEERRWRDACEQLGGDRIFQPTLKPLDPRVKPLLFYGYAPEMEAHPEDPRAKIVDIIHVSHNWWRWKELEESFFPAVGRMREKIGEICFLGLWWDGCPPWAAALGLTEAFRVDAARLQNLRITVRPPVPFTQVISTMSCAKVNIMTQRPLFQRLGIVSSKYFEIFCADTIPLVLIAPELAESVYGEAGRDLALRGNQVERRLLEALEFPERYSGVVQRVREHLRTHHSYRARVQQLVAALGT